MEAVRNGLADIYSTLNAVGFDLGSGRLSLLTLTKWLLVAVALYFGVRLVLRIARKLLGRAAWLDGTQKLLTEKLVTIAVLVIAGFVAIDLTGIDLTALTVFSGAFGLAVGFGLQKSFGNLIAGIILLMDRSIKPGDVIVVEGAVGRVNKIGVRAVSVLTRDGKEHLVPNELLMTERVENWSYSSRDVRIKMAISIAYDSDVHLAQRLMVEAASESPRVLDSPAPLCWIVGFGDNGIDHELRLWISDPEGGLGNVQGELFLRIWEKFRDAGIEIPYPRRDLRFVAAEPHSDP